MKENKLGILLSSFKENDWKRYSKFAKSRYGDETDCKLIIAYIKKHRSRYDPKRMDGEYLRKKIRPTAKPIVFANVMSQLCNHIEAYFIHAEVEDDQMMRDTLLLQAYGRRGVTDQFHKQKKKAKTNREKEPLGLWNNYHEFYGEYLTYFCNMTSGIADSKVVLDKSQVDLKAFEADLDGYLGVEMHNRTVLLNEDWSSKFKPLNLDKQDESLDLIYFHLKNLKERIDISSFNFLMTRLYEFNDSIELKYTIVTHLISNLNGRIRKGDNSLGSQLLDLYKYALEEDIIYPMKSIPFAAFINTLNISARLKDFDWGKEFVDEYAKFVSKSLTKEIIDYGYATLYYHKGEHQKVIELLRNLKFTDPFVEARVKWYLVCSHYELNNDDYSSLEYYIDSLKSYTRRNKDKSTIATSKSFLRSAKYLLDIIHRRRLDSVIKATFIDPSIFHRSWLRTKAEDRLKSKKGLQS